MSTYDFLKGEREKYRKLRDEATEHGTWYNYSQRVEFMNELISEYFGQAIEDMNAETNPNE